MQAFYHRRLPHISKDGATYFVTFRLANSVPKIIMEDLQKLHFGKFDKLLDKPLNGPYWLTEEPIAQLVYNSLLFYHPSTIGLHCFCIMSNHVHALFTPQPKAPPLHNIMKRIKTYTALQANKLLYRGGQFWERETYDHIVRQDGEFWRIMRYILNNPVKAGMAKNWQEWKWNWLSPDCSGLFPNGDL